MSAEPIMAMAPSDDAALVVGHRDGDPACFEALYRRYHPRLLTYLTAKTGDRATAEDLTHDTLLHALRAIDGYHPGRPLWPWLKTIATNLTIDRHRTRVRQLPYVDHDHAIRDADTTPAADPIDTLADRQLLASALAVLPDRQRVALSLRYLDDWTPGDIAALLDLTTNSVNQLLLRARRRLTAEYQRLTDTLGAWLWPLAWPLYALRDRVTRLRDTATTTAAPGPGMAAAEALTATAAITVLTTALALGSLISPPTTHAAQTPTPDRVLHGAAAPATGIPAAVATTTQGLALHATTTAPSAAADAHSPNAPPKPAPRELTAMTVEPAPDATIDTRSEIERDHDEQRVLIRDEITHPHPFAEGGGAIIDGETQIPCNGPTQERVCDTIEDFDPAPADG